MIIDAHLHPSQKDSADGFRDMMRRLAAAEIDLAIASDLGDWSAFPDSPTVRNANRRLRNGARRHAPRLQYLVYLNPQLPDWETELEAHRDAAVGVKLWISLKDANGSLERTQSVLRRAAQIGLPVLMHVYHRTGGPLPGEIDLNEFCDLCRAVPECVIIGAHAGGNWREALGRMRQLPPGKYYDISGGYPEHGMVEQLVRSEGAGRLVFGSDAMGRSFSSQLAKITHAQISPAEKEQILWRNAAEIFKLQEIIAQIKPLPTTRQPVVPPPRTAAVSSAEDHFCFCGNWPFADYTIAIAELAATLERHAVRHGFAVNLTDIFQDSLPERNRRFAAACAEYPVIAPLAIVDPRRAEAFAQLDSMSPFAGVWVSPYLHHYRLDAPELLPFWCICADKQIKIWINTAVSDYRFRPSSLAARPVAPDELYNFMKQAPENHYTVQAWTALNDAAKVSPPNGVWRFECSRLSDSERGADEFFAQYDGSILVPGSEFPFRDYPQVYESLAGMCAECAQIFNFQS